jgi:hypothetical protein
MGRGLRGPRPLRKERDVHGTLTPRVFRFVDFQVSVPLIPDLGKRGDHQRSSGGVPFDLKVHVQIAEIGRSPGLDLELQGRGNSRRRYRQERAPDRPGIETVLSRRQRQRNERSHIVRKIAARIEQTFD